jgi:hypothetical protein
MTSAFVFVTFRRLLFRPVLHFVLISLVPQQRRTDRRILVILCIIYALQVLDKNVIGACPPSTSSAVVFLVLTFFFLGYTAVLGLKKDAKLVGNQYATVTSMAPYAQIAAQPIGAFLLVRFPLRFLVPLLMLLWGTALMCMAAATNYQALLATRFLLGWFEASCLPAFTLITVSWYRRVEQPFRVAAWVRAFLLFFRPFLSPFFASSTLHPIFQ